MENENLALPADAKKAKIIWSFVALLFLLISLIFGFFTYKIITTPDYFKDKIRGQEGISPAYDKNGPVLVPRNIDGVLVEAGLDNIYPVGVMIDNHTAARPSFGLAAANLVIEAEAEGSITRYLAFYADGKEVEKIGPIRSARPYFIDYAREFSALYVHVGGSPKALALMKKDSVLHLNEFYDEEYFWRDRDGTAPHNVYSSSAALYGYLELKGLRADKFFPWTYKDGLDEANRPATSTIAINFGDSAYNVSWQYDYANNSYVRYLGGEIHREADSQVVSAANIAIARVDAAVIDEQMRLDMDTIGTGTAMVCLDGSCHPGFWKKDTPSARLRFYDEENSEFSFNRGTTWIEIVRPLIEIVY